MQKKTRIILALDVTSHAEAIRVVDAVKDYVDAIKIN